MFLTHLADLAYGVAAAGITLAVLTLFALAIVPKWRQAGMAAGDALAIGAACYVGLCWVAVGLLEVPLGRIAVAFALGAALLGAVWFRQVLARVTTEGRHELGRTALAFTLLYALAYVLSMPPASEYFLPVRVSSDVNLLILARDARQLLEFGSREHSSVAAYLLGGFSLGFRMDPLSAAAAAQCATVALLGVSVAGICRRWFGLSANTCLLIAAVAISSPFMRSLTAAYAWPALMAGLVVLFLVARRPAAISFASASLLLVLMAPTLQLASSVRAALAVAAFVPVGAAVALVTRWWANHPAAIDSPDRRLTKAFFVYVAIAMVVGNVAVSAIRDMPRVRIHAAWRGVEALNALPFRSYMMHPGRAGGSAAALVQYFMPGKTATVLALPLNELPFDSISRDTPLFLNQFDCAGVGHNDTVSVRAIGCLLLAPPSVVVGTSYPFNRTYLPVTFQGLSPRAMEGRHNIRETVLFTVLSDPQRTPVDRELYVNLLVFLQLPKDAPARPLRLAWGDKRRAETNIGEEEWISLPVHDRDWTGTRVRRLQLEAELPADSRMLFRDLSLSVDRRGRVMAGAESATAR